MSKLYGSMTSDAIKTDRTCRGHKKVSAHVRGWDFGIRVEAWERLDGSVEYQVFTTGGSNGSRQDETVVYQTNHKSQS